MSQNDLPNNSTIPTYIEKDELTHIIALTANASQSTEEECLNMGIK